MDVEPARRTQRPASSFRANARPDTLGPNAKTSSARRTRTTWCAAESHEARATKTRACATASVETTSSRASTDLRAPPWRAGTAKATGLSAVVMETVRLRGQGTTNHLLASVALVSLEQIANRKVAPSTMG